MADENAMENLDNLLLQLALQTRELSGKRDDLQLQIQVCRVSIQQKKVYIDENKKNVEKLDEQIKEKQKTVVHYKDNTKGLKRTHSLLLQYEKVLENELERRQDNCNRDTKMYYERVENYRAVLKKHKEQYHQHPLAQKLLKIQAENEEIERRIRAAEDRISAGEKERLALQGAAISSVSPEDPEESVSLSQVELQPLDQIESSVGVKDPLSQSAGGDAQDVDAGLGEETMEEPGAGECDEGRSRAPAGITSPGIGLVWTSPEARAVQREVEEQAQQAEMEQEDSFNMSGIAEGMGDDFDGVTVEKQGQDPPTASGLVGASDVGTAGDSTACPQTPPSRMKAVLSTPTFTLGSPKGPHGQADASDGKSPGFVFPGPLGRRDDSEGKSPGFEFPGPLGRRDDSETKSPGFEFTGPLGHSEDSEGKSPGFPFAMTSDPSTPTFTGFSFDMGSSTQGEETPFTFTSEYFSDKKSSDSKFTGFPFDQSESRSEEDFQFSFSSKSPAQNPTSEDKTASGDGFPFSFNFGKF